jgi:acyl-CoA reductase-like NAD-dependent aldehyde dehydrogenase
MDNLVLNDRSLLRTKAYIYGQWREADSGESLPIFNPANGEPIGTVPKCGEKETRDAIAAAAGCTVVVKPSELTPCSALALASLAERAGFPPGVLNVVTGIPAAIGAELTSNGPLINYGGVEKARDHIDDALVRGATALTRNSCGLDATRFVDPIVLTGVTTEMRLAQEETFGPVAPLYRFHDETEAIETANATPYGLASYFYTENIHRAWRVAERLEAGMVALNTGLISMEMAPVDGVKQSGLGREGDQMGI